MTTEVAVGPELDVLVATEVMGWRRVTIEFTREAYNLPNNFASHPKPCYDLCPYWWDDAKTEEPETWDKGRHSKGQSSEPVEDIVDYDYFNKGFNPSEDIESAWQVVERMRKLWYMIDITFEGRWEVEFYKLPRSGWTRMTYRTFEETAIRAALAAVRV